jgi:hypothetical protein
LKKEKKIYEKYGFKVVSAGPKFFSSLSFVKNFYKIITKHQFVASNEVGNYTFFAVDLGLPFFIVSDVVEVTNRSGKDLNIGDKLHITDLRMGRKAMELFNTGPQKTISKPQIEYVKSETGTEDCLSPAEMRKMLLNYADSSFAAIVRHIFTSLAADFIFNGPWIRLLIKTKLSKEKK